MPRIRNVSPWGALDVPLLGRIVEHGDEVEVEDHEAEILLDQPLNWEAVQETPPPAVQESTPTESTGSAGTPAEAAADAPTPEAPQAPTEPHTAPEGGDVQ